MRETYARFHHFFYNATRILVKTPGQMGGETVFFFGNVLPSARGESEESL